MREFLEKYGLRLLIITTACAVLISVLSFVSATSGFLQNAVGVLTYPFRSAVTAVATWAEDKQRYYKDYSDLIAENEALRERVAELERDARQAEADREENALLRELLELREQRRDLTFESAAVIDRESTNWTSALTLNRGTAHGVEKNDCVVSAEGDLVGVVSAVGYNWCTVLTVIDTDTELGARVFRTQEVAVAEGDLALMGEGKLKLSYLSADAQLLSLVWNNLFSNAVKFTEPHGKISLSLRTQGDFAVVQVSDTGCGIPPEVGKHIFAKFYQGDTSHATQGNASADVARTYLLFWLNGDIDGAKKYLNLFCKKSDTARQYVERWLPIVAASQSVKGKPQEREFLLSWVDVAEYQ